jgi:tetratricopeptide (TPR) repeat protein
MKTPPHQIAALACTALLLTTTSCRQSGTALAPKSWKTDVIRIDGVTEPAELLLPAEKAFVPTKQDEATLKTAQEFIKATENVKSGHEIDGLPALDVFIVAHPQMRDAYPLRATVRCMAGDFQGAKADIEAALSGIPRLLPDTGNSDHNELLALHAKLAFMAHDDETTSHDLDEIINSYNENISYLTDGRVKTTDKPRSPCGWTTEDVAEWLSRTHRSPQALVFRGMFAAAFAPLDDAAKPLTSRYTSESMQANPSFAPAYYYAAEGVLKICAYKELAFSEAQRAIYNDRLITLWTKAIELNPSIEKAYAERADSYYQRKNYPAAISDFDKALDMNPSDSGLMNDRALAKEETYDKSGAIADYTQAIALKERNHDSQYLANSLENRADLYVKLGDYKEALNDCTYLVGVKLHEVVPFINLAFFRELYPEYAKVDDVTLKDKLHGLYNPNQAKDDFEKMIARPEGIHPALDAGIKDTYLKRADVLLALKRFDAARRDYNRAELFKEHQDDDRWRTPPGLSGAAVDLRTLDVQPQLVKGWLKPNDSTAPFHITVDCARRTVQPADRATAFEPIPGTFYETVRDFFCGNGG